MSQTGRENFLNSERTAAATIGHVACLDGIRGISAFWVLFGHALSVTGPHSAAWGPLAHPQLAVDIFMFISGFLMMSHFQDRGSRGPGRSGFSWSRFWVRRYFRIAPFYYAAIVMVVLLRPALAKFEGANAAGYDYTDLSGGNIFEHLTFVFGMVKTGWWSRPIPDWSLSLEMQFYVAFPVFTLAWQHVGPIRTAAFVSALCVAAVFIFPNYFATFDALPSVLPLKLPLFFSGMLVATSLIGSSRNVAGLGLSVLLAVLPLPGSGGLPSCLVRAALFAGIILLIHADAGKATGALRGVAHSLGGGFGRFLGTASYGVYLVHFPLLMIIDPMLHAMVPDAGPGWRLAELLVLLIPATYAVAWAGHRLVEQPGIRLGSLLINAAFLPRLKMRSGW